MDTLTFVTYLHRLHSILESMFQRKSLHECKNQLGSWNRTPIYQASNCKLSFCQHRNCRQCINSMPFLWFFSARKKINEFFQAASSSLTSLTSSPSSFSLSASPRYSTSEE